MEFSGFWRFDLNLKNIMLDYFIVFFLTRNLALVFRWGEKQHTLLKNAFFSLLSKL
jgi:hypothetical protein